MASRTVPVAQPHIPIAHTWSCADCALDLSRPRVMGVLNVTPDSFSDGGEHNAPDAALETARRMVEDGVDIIDVGGESTRPGFTPVEPKEELRRLEPVVKALVERGVLVSIDTRHAYVARECVQWGAQIINDVTGFEDPAMVDVAAKSSCGCVVMHTGPVTGSRAATGTTADAGDGASDVGGAGNGGETGHGTDALSQLMNHASAGDRSWEKGGRLGFSAAADLDADARRALGVRPVVPNAQDAVGCVRDYLLAQAHALESAGVDSSRICLDPGVGFGKSPEDNVVLLRGTDELARLGYPLMCAVSRKRFVGTVSGVADAAARDAATIGLSLAASADGARVLRVHDVAGTVQALDGFWIASHPDVAMRKVAVEAADEIGLGRATAAMDGMPLCRVCAVGIPEVGKDGRVRAEARVATELDRVPFLRELGTAVDGTDAIATVEW